MKIKCWTYLLIGLLVLAFIGFKVAKKFNFNSDFSIGQRIDSLNDVFVYYNGGVDHVSERNTTTDGYNIGLKYQCVEFVKRYYYEHLNHKMPDSYGHAKDFLWFKCRSEEHTSELQSRPHLVCRLLLEKKKT